MNPRPCAPRERTCRRGFTLIELMIVVAVLGLLVTILVPSFLHWQHQAVLTKCMSNMRNLSQRIDARNTLSRAKNFPDSYDDGTPAWWLLPEVTELYDNNLLRCPGDSVYPNKIGGPSAQANDDFTSSYACNYWLDHDSDAGFQRIGGHVAPELLILFGESDTAYYRNNDPTELTATERSEMFPGTRHAEQLNFIMFDLSLRSLPVPEDANCGAIGREGDWGPHPCFYIDYRVAWTDKLSK